MSSIRTSSTSERTPLLRETAPEPIDDGAIEQNQAAVDAVREPPVMVQEVSGKKLALILGSVYLGVFLGALGMSNWQIYPSMLTRY